MPDTPGVDIGVGGTELSAATMVEGAENGEQGVMGGGGDKGVGEGGHLLDLDGPRGRGAVSLPLVTGVGDDRGGRPAPRSFFLMDATGRAARAASREGEGVVGFVVVAVIVGQGHGQAVSVVAVV